MKQLTSIGDRIGPVDLRDSDGREIELDTLLDRPVVVPLVRYYGCLPCTAYLRELEDLREDFESAGFRLVALGGAADYQARHLMDNGIGYPLLLDPDHTLYRALDVHRIHWWMMLSPRTWRKYLTAARRARQGRITDHPLQAPGLAIIDTDRTVRMLHRGRTLGDYPPAAQVLAEARRLMR
ncbi:MAG: redoxin domain-containing protein [Rhodococcus sp. (in: high G+C Gram-positive bacteria)]